MITSRHTSRVFSRVLYPEPLDLLPLWAVFLVAIAIVVVPLEIGYRIGRHVRRRPHEREITVDVMVAPALGLLAFILAFTFNLAQSRFETRRDTLLARVNAIGTVLQRADLAPEPHRTTIKRMVRGEVDAEAQVRDIRSFVKAVADVVHLQDTLWQAAAMAGREASPSTLGLLVVQSVNEMMDADQRRLNSLVTGRIPPLLWFSIGALAMLAMLLLGYDVGLAGPRRSMAMVPVGLSLAIVIFLIAVLDRPMEGFTSGERVSQEQLRELVRRQ